MPIKKELIAIMNETLNLDGRAATFDDQTPLLGALPELDSMGVVALMAGLEDRFGFMIEDDEMDSAYFQTFGALLKFVEQKLGA